MPNPTHAPGAAETGVAWQLFLLAALFITRGSMAIQR
jgi:hypothetical protein